LKDAAQKWLSPTKRIVSFVKSTPGAPRAGRLVQTVAAAAGKKAAGPDLLDPRASGRKESAAAGQGQGNGSAVVNPWAGAGKKSAPTGKTAGKTDIENPWASGPKGGARKQKNVDPNDRSGW
jgi:hypothetical protein